MSDTYGPKDEKIWHQLQNDAAALSAVQQLLFPAGATVDTTWTEDLTATPVIIDTAIGGDPDDALAVAAAARGCPWLALVITTAETRSVSHQRARFARWLLDELGRPDVKVVAGATLGEPRYYCVNGLAPDSSDVLSSDVVAAVQALCEVTAGPVRWVALGPMTNLSSVISQSPETATRLRLTQLGGALDNFDPSVADHNLRSDVPASRTVLNAVAEGLLPPPRFIGADVKFHPSIAVTANSMLYRRLCTSEAPGWARTLREHADRWFAQFYPQTFMHGSLALSAALALPFVESDLVRAVIADTGLVRRGDDGVLLRWSTRANFVAFMTWLERLLDPSQQSAAPTERGGR